MKYCNHSAVGKFRFLLHGLGLPQKRNLFIEPTFLDFLIWLCPKSLVLLPIELKSDIISF
jgi:hypothetical protein